VTSVAQGPYFDELTVGQEFADAPSLTLTAGRAASHQAIVGDRLRLPLDDHLATRVSGSPLAHPALVCNVAIGQSTLATQHVKANLFYRDLVLLRQPAIGDSLRTITTVVAMRENAQREGRRPTGLVALRMQTIDQRDRQVLDFFRCAMLPLAGPPGTGCADDLDAIGGGASNGVSDSVAQWDLAAVSDGSRPEAGESVSVFGGDVVSSAPELARLTLNIAAVHHDETSSDTGRLVYGGHTIAIALSQVARAFPDLLTVLSWTSCDHVGPVREGDTLHTQVEVLAVRPGAVGNEVDLRAFVTARPARPVLDWRFTALFP